jgi:hypothetical protein
MPCFAWILALTSATVEEGTTSSEKVLPLMPLHSISIFEPLLACRPRKQIQKRQTSLQSVSSEFNYNLSCGGSMVAAAAGGGGGDDERLREAHRISIFHMILVLFEIL